MRITVDTKRPVDAAVDFLVLLIAQFDGAHNCCIQFAARNGGHGEFHGGITGEFLSRDSKPGTSDIELIAEAVGGHVRHLAYDARGIRR